MPDVSIFRQTSTIIAKDLRRELRSREIVTTTVSFAVLLVVIFTFSFYRSNSTTMLVFPGILWVSIIFAGTLAIQRSFAQEKERGCLRAMALVPGTHLSLYLGKFVVNLLFVSVFELVLAPVLLLVFDISMAGSYVPFVAAVVAGTVGFCALGTMVAAMLVHHRMREVLLPLLLYPMLVPLVIFGVKSTALLVDAGARAPEQVWSWLQFMALFDVVLLSLSPPMFRWVLDAIE
jgi:heme exporter protein B